MILVQLFEQLDRAWGTQLAPDRWWLALQVGLLLGIMVREVALPRNRNLYALLTAATMLVLVQGQAWWMLDQLQQAGWQMTHLYQTITLDSARLANAYAGLGVLCFVIAYGLAGWGRRGDTLPAVMRTQLITTPRSYLWAAAWTLGASIVLIAQLGGLRTALAEPGRSIPGQTMLLVVVGLGKLPLLRKVALRQRFVLADVALLAVTFSLTLLNSRFLAAFMLLQLALLLNYCWRPVSRRALLGLAGIFFVVFIVFGLYRDFGNRTAGGGSLDVTALQQYFATRTPANTLDWFYRGNVEGFAGLAGILTYESANHGLAHDFGLSTLTVFTQLIPNAWRHNPDLPFAPVADFLAASYPYGGSVVPPGLEMAYAHFGLPGILGFGLLLGYLVAWLHKQMLNATADRVRVGLYSVQILQMVRGTFVTTIFFALADVTMLAVYRSMLATRRPALGDSAQPALPDAPP